MAIYIGHASISEKGTAQGVKGDQTGNEVCVRTWYNYSGGWDFIAIHPDANVREKHAKTVEAACANDNCGYGQDDRNSLHTQAVKKDYDLSAITEPCNCDCSSLQHVAAIASGGMEESSYGSNAMVTSTMKERLKSAGYKIITDSTYTQNSSYCVRGGIYCKSGHHTVTGLSNGSNYLKTLDKAGVSTSSSTTGSTGSGTTDKLTIDGQIGPKTVIRWQEVMGQSDKNCDGFIDGQPSGSRQYWTSLLSSVCKWTGGSSAVVKKWQQYLIGKGYSCGSSGADGQLGKNTALASQKYLIANGFSCGTSGADGWFGDQSARAFQNWLNTK